MGIGAMVDPQERDVRAYAEFARSKDLRIAHVIPLLSLDRDAFIEAVSVVPERPADMERLMRINRGRA
jgi:hypothetical protein